MTSTLDSNFVSTLLSVEEKEKETVHCKLLYIKLTSLSSNLLLLYQTDLLDAPNPTEVSLLNNSFGLEVQK